MYKVIKKLGAQLIKIYLDEEDDKITIPLIIGTKVIFNNKLMFKDFIL